MKLFLTPSMLLVALSALAFTSALSPGLEQLQGQIIDTTPTVADCANASDCKNAAAWWNDCQGAHVTGMPFDPSSNVRSCLCPPGRAAPSHVDWYAKFRNCIICVEMAIGNQYPSVPMYMQMEQIAGSPSSSVGYCHGTMSTQQFVQKMKDLVKAKNFPLGLPEAVLPRAGGEVARAVTPITLANPMHSTIPFSVSTALAHSGFMETATPTAVFNSQFSTFQAVSMSSVLASLAAASSSTPTAVFNSQFSTFEAVPMSSFVSSLSSSTPTAVFNSQFSTFEAVPMSSVLASLSTAMVTPTSSQVQTSKTSAGQVSTPPASAPANSCSHDNCFRQALRSEPAVVSFCASHTKTPQNAATGFPKCLSAYQNSPAKISSACSCVARHTSSIANALPTSTSKSYAPTPTSISTRPANSTTTPTSSSPTGYPTADPTNWITLPASDAVKACAASKSCVNANIYHDTCMKESDEGAWNCLCKKLALEWKINLGQCTQCLDNALPRFAGNEPLNSLTERDRDRFCHVTGPKAGAKNALVTVGAMLTEKYQSSLALFNMTLIDAPYRPQPTPSPAPAPAPDKWASLPASPEVVACSRSSECLRAGQIFNTCAAEEKKQGGNVKYCFCNTNVKEWKSSLSTCAKCVAAHLPNTPPSTAPESKDLMMQIVEKAYTIYCEPASQGSIERLQKAGLVITSHLQSPVKFFDMSLITEAIPIPN